MILKGLIRIFINGEAKCKSESFEVRTKVFGTKHVIAGNETIERSVVRLNLSNYSKTCRHMMYLFNSSARSHNVANIVKYCRIAVITVHSY